MTTETTDETLTPRIRAVVVDDLVDAVVRRRRSVSV